MSAELTLETILAAKDNDLSAVRAISEATEPRVMQLATKYAYRMASFGNVEDFRDEFAQVARISVWESLQRFSDDTADTFPGFVYHTIDGALKDAAREARHPGSDHDAMKVFGKMLIEAGGDPYVAVELCRTVPAKKKQLTRERAWAAMEAWQGGVSLDMQINEGGTTLADTLSDDLEIPADLITADDLSREDRRVKIAKVHGVLDAMGGAQSSALRSHYGIAGAPGEQTPSCATVAELAAEAGVDTKVISRRLSTGRDTFGNRWIKAFSKDEDEANSLRAAMKSAKAGA